MRVETEDFTPAERRRYAALAFIVSCVALAGVARVVFGPPVVVPRWVPLHFAAPHAAPATVNADALDVVASPPLFEESLPDDAAIPPDPLAAPPLFSSSGEHRDIAPPDSSAHEIAASFVPPHALPIFRERHARAPTTKIDPIADTPLPIDTTSVRIAIDRRRTAALACYERASREHGLSGRVVLGLVVAPDGSVDAARIEEDTLADGAVGTCLAGLFRSARLDAHPAEATTVHVPFVFASAQ